MSYEIQKYFRINRILLVLSILISTALNADVSSIPPEIDLSSSFYKGVLRIYGDYPEGQAGLSVNSGDFNGDGLDDVVIGSVKSDPGGRENAGEVYVVFGSQNLKTEDILDLRYPPAGVLRIMGNVVGSEFGRAVAAGDMDGDGYDDLIIGAWRDGRAERLYAGPSRHAPIIRSSYHLQVDLQEFSERG